MLFKRKPKVPNFYEEESTRIKEMLKTQTPGTDEYKNTMTELVKLQAFAGKDQEMKAVLTKEGRAAVAGKVIGFIGLGGLAFGLTRFEKTGHLFSGSAGETVKSLVRLGAKFFG